MNIRKAKRVIERIAADAFTRGVNVLWVIDEIKRRLHLRKGHAIVAGYDSEERVLTVEFTDLRTKEKVRSRTYGPSE